MDSVKRESQKKFDFVNFLINWAFYVIGYLVPFSAYLVVYFLIYVLGHLPLFDGGNHADDLPNASVEQGGGAKRCSKRNASECQNTVVRFIVQLPNVQL